jgi:hypothetical protein
MGTDGTSQREASAKTRTGVGLHSAPRFLQGAFAFEGRGIDQPFPIGGALSYTVPDGVTAPPGPTRRISRVSAVTAVLGWPG